MAELRSHVPALRHTVRGGLAGQERQRLRVHDGDPGRPGAPDRRHRIQLALRGPRPARCGLRGDDGGLSRHRPARLRTGLRRLVAGSPAARDGAELRLPGGAPRFGRRDGPGRPGLPARGRDRYPRSPLEDPLDAQLRPALGDAQPARGDGAGPRPGRRGTPGSPPEFGVGPQLGFDRGPLADEERDPRRRRPAGCFRTRGRRPDRRGSAIERARQAVHRRADGAIPARIRMARRLEPRVHLPDGPRGDGADPRAHPRLPDDRLRLPERHRGDAPRHRGRLRRTPAGSEWPGARGDASGQRRQPADGAVDARPPLLYRSGCQCPCPACPARGRPQAGRARPPRSARRRAVPALQRAPRPHRQCRRDRRPRDRRGTSRAT